MIFSVQNSNHMYSVEFSPDLVQIQVRQTVSENFLARMDISIHVWHMVEVMQKGFNEHHVTQVPTTDNQLGSMQMMEEVSDHVGMNYHDTSDSRYVAQSTDDFLFPWEEGSVEKEITIEEDEGFSEPRTPASEPPRQPPAMEARPVLRFIENMQKFENSAARQLFDL